MTIFDSAAHAVCGGGRAEDKHKQVTNQLDNNETYEREPQQRSARRLNCKKLGNFCDSIFNRRKTGKRYLKSSAEMKN